MIDSAGSPGPVEPIRADFAAMGVEASVTPVAVLARDRVKVDDPLSPESHPYRPSVDLSVAVLCVEMHDGVPCNTIYASEIEKIKPLHLLMDGERVHDQAVHSEGCPRCGSAAAFEVRRVIR